jgi:hypothetical protein
MSVERIYSSRRQSITDALADILKQIDGTGEFLSDLEGRVLPKFKFWDQIEEFPALHLNPGGENRVYQSGGYKDRFLGITLRIYVETEDPQEALGRIIEDVETVLEENSSFQYFDKQGACQRVHQITILSIDTDEGVLEPLGVGEISIQVQY